MNTLMWFFLGGSFCLQAVRSVFEQTKHPRAIPEWPPTRLSSDVGGLHAEAYCQRSPAAPRSPRAGQRAVRWLQAGEAQSRGAAGAGDKPAALRCPWAGALAVGGGARSPAGSEQWPVRPDSSPGRLRGPCSCTGPFPRAPGSGQHPKPACTARGAEPGTGRLRARGRLLCGPG